MLEFLSTHLELCSEITCRGCVHATLLDYILPPFSSFSFSILDVNICFGKFEYIILSNLICYSFIVINRMKRILIKKKLYLLKCLVE